MTTATRLAIFAAAMLGAAMLGAAHLPAQTPQHTFAIGPQDFLLDGQKIQIRCGEIHAARVPKEYWRHRLRMARAMGLNTVCAYLFWNQVEARPGQFNWSGQADAAEFDAQRQAAMTGLATANGPTQKVQFGTMSFDRAQGRQGKRPATATVVPHTDLPSK